MSEELADAALIAATATVMGGYDPALEESVEVVQATWYWLPPSLPAHTVVALAPVTLDAERVIVALRPADVPHRASERAWRAWTYGFPKVAA